MHVVFVVHSPNMGRIEPQYVCLRPLLASSVTVAEAPSDIGWQALGPVIACTILAVIVVMLR